MSQKYTLLSNTTTGDRLGKLIKAAVQLSTGDLVMLVKDPSAADPNKVLMYLVPGSAHTTPSLIATLATANSGSGTGTQFADDVTEITLARDASDNIYVVGTLALAAHTDVYAQAYTKGSGLTWTAQSAAFCYGVGDNIYSVSAVWANTGGGTNGKGHLVINITCANVDAYVGTADCGALLTGTSAFVGVVIDSNSLGTGATNTNSCDIAQNGFGATSGWFCNYHSATKAEVGTWSVTTGGVLTLGNPTQYSWATPTATTRAHVVSIKSNRCALIVPSSANAGQLTVSLMDQNAASLSSADTGTASNFPAPSAALSWDAFTANNNLYVLGWSSTAAQTMLAVAVSFPSDVVTIGSTISIDTAIGSGTNTTIRAVTNPVDTSHVDVQGYNTTSPFSLLGDFANLPATMNPPTLLLPAALTSQDLASGFTFTWQNNAVTLGDAQVSYAFQRQAAGAAPQWWTGSAWQSTEIFVTNAAAQTVFAAANWTRNTTYTWTIAVKGANGTSSGYASAQTVYSSAALPTTPTLTASFDSANNRVTLTIAGTGTDTAEFQVSRDGGTTWADVRSSGAVAQISGAATVYDYEAQPGLASKYRVAQKDSSQGVYAINSAWSTTQTVTPSNLTQFWLRNPADGTIGMSVNVKEGTFQTQITENMAVHYPLGSSYPVVLADTLKGEDGQCTIFTMSSTDETNLKALMSQQNTLLLQTNDSRQWYIRLTDARKRNIPPGTGPSPYKEWAVSWVQVAQP